MECKPKISVAKACCTQRRQCSQTPEWLSARRLRDANTGAERKRANDLLGKQRRIMIYLRMKKGIIAAKQVEEVGGGRYKKKIGYWCCCIDNVAFAPVLAPLCGERQRTEGGEGWRTDGGSSDGWLVNGWTALNDAISQQINGPWWASVRASMLTRDFVCCHCQQ